MITFALATWFVAVVALVVFAKRGGQALNAHAPMPVEVVEIAPVLWGPWADHTHSCTCSVCR